MLESFKNKFSNLRKKDSIVHKLDNIKKIEKQSSSSHYSPDGQLTSSAFTFDNSKLEEMQEETVKKIDEMLNSKAESINANAESIKTIDNKISKMDISISTVKRSMEEYNGRFTKMEDNILELLSLYEIVSNTVNPFVGDNENKPINIEKFDFIEKRLNNLEGSLEHFGQIDSNVSEEVLQQVRNEIYTKLSDLSEKMEKLDLQSKSKELQIGTIDNSDFDNQEATIQYFEEVQRRTISSNAPLLASINNAPETSIILLNWVEFLMEKVGRNNLLDVLDYYAEIGWISEGVSNKILAYASGIDYYDEKPTWKLMPQDHTKSLMFIERLHGKKIDVGTLHKIERDMDKVKHHSEPYFKV
jgi:flagellar protein FlaD